MNPLRREHQLQLAVNKCIVPGYRSRTSRTTGSTEEKIYHASTHLKRD